MATISTTQEIFDERDLPYQTTDAESRVTKLNYTPNGTLAQVIDGNGHATAYAPDDFDRLKTITHADATTEQFLYDADSIQHNSPTAGVLESLAYDYYSSGTIQHTTDHNGLHVFGYDHTQELTSVDYPSDFTVYGAVAVLMRTSKFGVLSLARRILQIPFYTGCWSRAYDAARLSDWEQVIRSLIPLNHRGLATDESRIWLADAYGRLERWQVCVDELERIERPLPGVDREARRNFNHSLVLAKLGRFHEAAAVLERSWDQEWPEAIRADASRLREYLREGHVGDLRVLH